MAQAERAEINFRGRIESPEIAHPEVSKKDAVFEALLERRANWYRTRGPKIYREKREGGEWTLILPGLSKSRETHYRRRAKRLLRGAANRVGFKQDLDRKVEEGKLQGRRARRLAREMDLTCSVLQEKFNGEGVAISGGQTLEGAELAPLNVPDFMPYSGEDKRPPANAPILRAEETGTPTFLERQRGRLEVTERIRTQEAAPARRPSLPQFFAGKAKQGEEWIRLKREKWTQLDPQTKRRLAVGVGVGAVVGIVAVTAYAGLRFGPGVVASVKGVAKEWPMEAPGALDEFWGGVDTLLASLPTRISGLSEQVAEITQRLGLSQAPEVTEAVEKIAQAVTGTPTLQEIAQATGTPVATATAAPTPMPVTPTLEAVQAAKAAVREVAQPAAEAAKAAAQEVARVVAQAPRAVAQAGEVVEQAAQAAEPTVKNMQQTAQAWLNQWGSKGMEILATDKGGIWSAASRATEWIYSAFSIKPDPEVTIFVTDAIKDIAAQGVETPNLVHPGQIISLDWKEIAKHLLEAVDKAQKVKEAGGTLKVDLSPEDLKTAREIAHHLLKLK